MKDQQSSSAAEASSVPEQTDVIVKALDDMPAFLTIPEVGLILRMSKPKVYSLIHQNGFPLKQIDRKFLVQKNEFIRWLKTKSVNT